MIETLSNKNKKARKEHTCNYCDGKIKKNEIYENSTIKHDDEIYTWKNHLKCSKLAQDLNMFDELWGDGLTGENFIEAIQEFLNNNLPKDVEECFWGEDAVDKAIEILKIKEGVK